MSRLILPEWPLDRGPRFVVLNRLQAGRLLSSESRSHLVTDVISIASPPDSRAASWVNVKAPHGYRKHPARKSRYLFDDIDYKSHYLFDDIDHPGDVDEPSTWTFPSEDDARSMLNHFRKVPKDGFLLIHCQAGQSRSAAVGFAFACFWFDFDDMDERGAYRLTCQVTPNGCIPNRLLVEHFDRLLGRQGRMLAAMDEANSAVGYVR